MVVESKLLLGLVFAMLMQIVTAIMWAGGAAERLSGVEQQLRDQRAISERLARLEADLSAARRQLHRIEGKLE